MAAQLSCQLVLDAAIPRRLRGLISCLAKTGDTGYDLKNLKLWSEGKSWDSAMTGEK